jgi:hypothetical protein
VAINNEVEREREREREEKKDVYSDELLFRFLSSSHHLFLIAMDSEGINHARNKNIYTHG